MCPGFGIPYTYAPATFLRASSVTVVVINIPLRVRLICVVCMGSVVSCLWSGKFTIRFVAGLDGGGPSVSRRRECSYWSSGEAKEPR